MGRKSSLKAQHRAARAAEARAVRAGIDARTKRGCLFCRQSDGGFSSQEHVLPESLGNKDRLLPRGVVCDRCNNGTLSVLDQALCDFMPMKALRTFAGVPSKAGRVPVTRLSTGLLRRSDSGAVVVEVHNPNDNRTFVEKGREGGRVQIGMELQSGSRMTPRYCAKLARAVLKVGLESAWIDHGERMVEHSFDHVRDAVLGRPRDGFLLVGRRCEGEDPEVSVVYGFARDDDGDERLWVGLKYLGMVLATDSRLAEPPGASEEEALVFTFRRSDERGAA